MHSGLLDISLPSIRQKSKTNLTDTTSTVFPIVNNVEVVSPLINNSCLLTVVNNLTTQFTSTPFSFPSLITGELYQGATNFSCQQSLLLINPQLTSNPNITLTDAYSTATIPSCSITPITLFEITYNYV
jgi:hypothetical protein